jgi:glutathione S-transferase
MERIDNKLGDSGGPWVCGGLFSLADIGFAGIDDRIEYRIRK